MIEIKQIISLAIHTPFLVAFLLFAKGTHVKAYRRHCRALVNVPYPLL